MSKVCVTEGLKGCVTEGFENVCYTTCSKFMLRKVCRYRRCCRPILSSSKFMLRNVYKGVSQKVLQACVPAWFPTYDQIRRHRFRSPFCRSSVRKLSLPVNKQKKKHSRPKRVYQPTTNHLTNEINNSQEREKGKLNWCRPVILLYSRRTYLAGVRGNKGKEKKTGKSTGK